MWAHCQVVVVALFFFILLLVPLLTLLSAWVVHWHMRHHPDYERNTVLERSFSALSFPLHDGGQLTGQAVE